MPEIMKRATAYKLRIGDILKASPVIEEERMVYAQIGDKQIIRVNVVANIIDKFESEGEKKYLTFTIDDASGQIRLKVFSDYVDKFKAISQGDTVVVIGTLRYYNNEIYINPEIIKKIDPSYLLVRKLETERNDKNNPIIDKVEIKELRDKILELIKLEDDNGGVEMNKLVMELKNEPELISKEIQKLLEDGLAYEPRPGKIRILG